MDKVSTETLNKLLDKANNNVKVVKIGEIDGKDIEIEIKQSITMDEFFSVCTALSTSPFAKTDNDVSMYVPTSEISVFKVALIKAFIPNIELPEDLVEAYHLCSKLNLFQVLHNTLKHNDMYRDLHTAAERYSEFHRVSNSGLSNIVSFAKNVLEEINIGEYITKFVTEFKSGNLSNNTDETYEDTVTQNS